MGKEQLRVDESVFEKDYWGEGITVNLEGNVLSFGGVGKIKDFQQAANEGKMIGIKKLVIDGEISRIGDNAFAHNDIERVLISVEAVSVGSCAFCAVI